MKYQKLQYITCYEHFLAYEKLTQNNCYAYTSNLNLVKWKLMFYHLWQISVKFHNHI